MKGKTGLPDDFAVTPAMRAWADKAVPTLDVDYYHEEFCDHWRGNGKKMADWRATWQNWMRRTDRGAAPGLYGPDDRRIQRRRPRAVPQGELPLVQLSDRDRRIHAYQEYLVYLQGVAMVAGIFPGTKSAWELEVMLGERGVGFDEARRPAGAKER